MHDVALCGTAAAMLSHHWAIIGEHYPQNQKYIMYYNLPKEDQATGNMYRKSDEVLMCDFRDACG